MYLGDVIAPQVWSPQVQESVSEPLSRLDQQSPCLGAADAVDIDRALSLECLDRLGRCRVEDAGDRAAPVTGRVQPVLEVSNVRTCCADAERSDQRNSPISASKALFGLAPTRRLAGSPSRNMMSVGMLITW